MKKVPRFRIRILSPSGCELQRPGEEWRKQFVSVKGALDFIGCLQGSQDARITITDPKGERYMRVVW